MIGAWIRFRWFCYTMWWASEFSWRRMVVAHPDLCIWMVRRFRVGLNHYRKAGAARGVTILSLGWVAFSVRH